MQRQVGSWFWEADRIGQGCLKRQELPKIAASIGNKQPTETGWKDVQKLVHQWMYAEDDDDDDVEEVEEEEKLAIKQKSSNGELVRCRNDFVVWSADFVADSNKRNLV